MAQTGDAAAGADKYQTVYANPAWPLRPNAGSCVGCHGSAQAPSISFRGRASPAGIAFAIASNRGGKGFLDGLLSTQDLTDIAAYIANPDAGGVSAIQIEPAAVRLSAPSGQPALASLLIANPGSRPLLLNAISVSGTGFALDAARSTCAMNQPIAPLDACQLGLRHVSSAGSASAAGFLVVNHNAAGGVSSIRLDATVGPGAVLRIDGGPLRFGTLPLGTASQPRSLALMNAGDATLTLGSIVFGTDDFTSQAESTCRAGVTLAPGSACTMQLSFQPDAAGSRAATLSVTHDGLGGLNAIGLLGTGQTPSTPVGRASSPRLDFGQVIIGQSAKPQILTLSNIGGSAWAVSRVSVSNAAFSVIAETCSASPVAPGASCTVELGYVPAQAGAASAQLVVTSNASGAQPAVALTGEGVPVGQAVLLASPVGADFGTTPLNENRSILLTLRNGGTSRVVLGALQLAGLNAADFAIGPASGCRTGIALDPAATCTFDLRFAPSGIGARSAALDLGVPGVAAIRLDGVGSPTPGVLRAESGERVDWGVVSAGTRETRTLVLSAQDADVLIGSITVSAPFFVDASSECGTNGFTLAAGRRCTLVLAFSALAAGENTGRLGITSTASGSPQAIRLSATVARPNAAQSSGGCSLGSRIQDGDTRAMPTDPVLPALALAAAALLALRRRR